MRKVEVFEAGGCCSTGVTNPEEKRESIRFSVAINQLVSEGYDVARYNILSDTAAFDENATVKKALNENFNQLPITLVDGKIVKIKILPSNEELAEWTGLDAQKLGGKPRIRLEIRK